MKTKLTPEFMHSKNEIICSRVYGWPTVVLLIHSAKWHFCPEGSFGCQQSGKALTPCRVRDYNEGEEDTISYF
jgi:hypothetical protein